LVPYRLTSLAIGLAIAFTILWLVRRDLLHTRYSIWWLVVAGASALLGGFPSVVDGVASWLGVTYPPILLVIVGMGLLLIKMLTMDVERSDQERRLRILIQRLAVLEGEQQVGQQSGHGDRHRGSSAGPKEGEVKEIP
jgi:cell division protein FtsW (lipid II flippase)